MGTARMVWEDHDPVRHLAMVEVTTHPVDEAVPLETSLKFAIEMAAELGPEVNRWRSAVIMEMRARVEEMEQELTEWYAALPAHGKDAYYSRGAIGGCVAWPALRNLGQVMGYPGIQEIFKEATLGFKLLGEVPRGQGWRQKKTEPEVPLPWAEIIQERALGRMWGPFEAPPESGIETVPLPEM